MGAAPGTQRRLGAERSRRLVSRTLTEAEWQRDVIDLAHLHRWRVAHFRAATLTNGRTITPVAADGAGWPDLVLVRGRLLFRELKTNRGRLQPHQEAWGAALQKAGCDWGVWRPRDFDEVLACLTRRP